MSAQRLALPWLSFLHKRESMAFSSWDKVVQWTSDQLRALNGEFCKGSSGMVRLSVNVNKVATLRNARGGDIPNVIRAARTCIEAGCHGITVHPRPDGRHIRYQDVMDLAAMLTVEFNIEGYPLPEFLDLV